MFKKFFLLFVLILTTLYLNFSFAIPKNTSNENDEIQKLFADWTHAFNTKELTKACDLFSKNVIADYQGVPQKNYQSICNGFNKIFSNIDEKYEYNFNIHQIYSENDLAAVRITWYLKHFKNNKLISITQDEGLDVLKKNEAGAWQIVNYIGYQVK